MTINITLQEQRKKVHHIKLESNYSESAELKLVKCNNQSFDGIEIKYSIYAMPGFCLIDELVNANRFETIDFDVKGNCHIISLYSSGKFEITDYAQNNNEFYVAGSINTSFSIRSNWGLSVYNDQETHRYILILTSEYLSKFLENDKWITNNSISPTRSLEDNQREFSKMAYIDSPIKNILAEISNACYESIYRRTFIEFKIKELLFLIHTQRKDKEADDNLPPTVYQKLISAKAYLISNYIDAPSIAQLSRIISLNEFYLKIHFKGLFGITIHSFIIQLRMEAAEKLLRTNCSVIETSARTGYRSTSHFINVFKKHYGKTPKQAYKELKV